MGKIQDIEERIEAIRLRITTTEAEIADLKAEAVRRVEQTARQALEKLEKEKEAINEEADAGLSADTQQPFWVDEGGWKGYTPITKLDADTLPSRLLTGTWGTLLDEEFLIPAYIPFFRDQKTILIEVNNEWKEQGHSLLKALIERIHTLLPHYVQFTLLDPETNGAAFPMQRDIFTRQNDSDMYHLLEAVIGDMRRINSISALTEKDYFSTKVESVTMNEKYEFVCAAHFPKGYDARCIEKLNNIGNIGYVSGKYLIVVYNTDEPLPRDVTMDSFKDAIHINLAVYDDWNTFEEEDAGFDFHPEEEASVEVWRKIVDRLAGFKPVERKITWDEHIAVAPAEMWKGNAANLIETTIGDVGGKPLNVWFGKKDGANCAHGMLAATTGAGKSNFYHALILGLATRYSPDELRMYLIDGKNGVEFEVYRSFPHAEVVSLKSSAELTGSVLSELVSVVARRNEIFKKSGVNSYDEYRKSDKNRMPRILLLIDEYQVLFEGKEAAQASDDLRLLTAQARSAGIHLLLGSQRFSVPNMQNKDAVFGNIQLRIALKMTQDDRIALTEFGKEGKEFVRACDLPGQIVVNQNSGSDGSNQLGKVAFIDAGKKAEIIRGLVEKACREHLDDRIMHTIVFEGDSAPNMDENPEWIKLASAAPLSLSDLQKLARTPEYAGGFGKPDWNRSESPLIGWIGQAFNVYGQASIVIRRRKMENILLVGDRNASRYGMLVSLILGFAMNGKKDDISFYIFDRSVSGTEWNPYLRRVGEEVLRGAGYTVCFATKVKDIEAGLTEANDLLNERLRLDQDERSGLKPVCILLTEPEDIESLNLVMDKNGFKTDSSLGEKLTNLAVNGSQAGVHLILSSSGVVALQNVLPKKQFTYFRHRIALQISDQESFDFLQNRAGSMLQTHGEVPTVGYYADMNGNIRMKFKPYSLIDEGFERQFATLKTYIANR